MKEKLPSIKEWKELYNTSIEFKKIECWNWMFDSDLFGVMNPENSEIGYCCILGNLGEVFGIAVYIGTEGLEGYLKIQSGELSHNDFDIKHTQKCLMLSFQDRDMMQKRDLEIIKKIGIKFRGSKAWPLFRNYQPGYHPWHLNSNEAKYLILVLQQTVEICHRFRNDKEMLKSSEKNYYLVRIPEKKGTSLIWRDQWLKPQPLNKAKILPISVDDIHLQQIKKKILRQHGIWEIDFFYSPMAVRDKGERPYYPYIILFVEKSSGAILNFHMTKHEQYEIEFLDTFLALIEKVKILPEEIEVKNVETLRIFEKTASILGINLVFVEKLYALEEAQEAMFESFA